MKQKLLVALAALLLLVSAARAVDLEFAHFEDGSGKVSWCLPASGCTPSWHEWDVK